MSPPELGAHPFYAARMDDAGRSRPWSLEELEDFALATGDPYGGRLAPEGPAPALSLQLEACDDPTLWVGLAPDELAGWSRALTGIWRRNGVQRGEAVALFDYGSSPAVLLASSTYVPYLARGAAERLGATVICNDGVATFAERMVEIAADVRPAALWLRRDVVAPLREVFATAGTELAAHCRWVALGEAEGAPDAGTACALAEAWGVPVRRVLRADAAFLLAGDCARCGDFHLDRRLYALEELAEGGLAVTTRFARLCPAARYRLEGASRVREPCAAEPRAWRLRCP